MSYRKGQWVVCKYHGDNGDLIVGRVESVRRNGMILLSAPSGATSTKRAAVLDKRNQVVPAREAKEVVYLVRSGDKTAARMAAIKVADRYATQPPLEWMSGDSPVIEQAPKRELYTTGSITPQNVFAVYNKLSLEERQAFARLVWGDVLSVFGVQ